MTHSKSVGVAAVTLGTGLREQGERSKGQTRARPDLTGRKLTLSCPPASRRCFPLAKRSQNQRPCSRAQPPGHGAWCRGVGWKEQMEKMQTQIAHRE